MDDAVDLVVVLVTHDSADVLPGFLDGLAAACSGCSWRLVVADNDSRDGSPQLVRDAIENAVVVETGSNAGYAAGINAAVAAAPDSRFLLISNPDIRIPAGAVGDLLDAWRPGVGLLGPRIVDPDGSLALSLHRAPTVSRAASDALLGGERIRRWPGETLNDPRDYERARDVDWLSGAFLVMPREVHDLLGGWDPRFFLYSEETDLALRAADAGWRVRYDPVCTVTHVGGESTTSPELYGILTVNRVRLVGKRRGRPYAALYAAVVLVGELLRSVSSREPLVHRAAVVALLRPSRRSPRVRSRLAGDHHAAPGS